MLEKLPCNKKNDQEQYKDARLRPRREFEIEDGIAGEQASNQKLHGPCEMRRQFFQQVGLKGSSLRAQASHDHHSQGDQTT